MFKERLKQLRLEKGFYQPELAKELNIAKQTVSNWENGNRVPDAETLIKIANYFNCSVDYLLGNSDIKNPQHELKIKKAKSLKDELIELMEKRSIIKNIDDIDEEHLKLIEMAIKTYADKTNNKKDNG